MRESVARKMKVGFRLCREAASGYATGVTMLDTRDHPLPGPMGISAGQGKFIIGLVAMALIAALWLTLVDQVRFERQRMVAAAILQNENRASALRQYVMRTLDLAGVAAGAAMKGNGPGRGADWGATAAT